MPSRPVPSLSTSGWVTEIREKADLLMGYFFYSDASQSNIFAGKITSLPNIIKQYGNDKIELQTQLQNQVSIYLTRYFDLVSVNVSVTVPENPDDNRMDVQMDVIVSQDGVKYDLSRLLRLANKVVKEIINLNNTGE